mmetsp:Transcript_17899/g.39696  ORF Transcript_17899/g.39696 Transcript_17899/m.39696 type:complete len:177 (-) Transcript_17899:178-708(-)
MTEETAEAIVSRSIVSGWIIPFLWRFGTVVGGLLTVAVGLLYVKQDSLLYFPAIGEVPRRPGQNPRGYRSPAEHQIPYETHMIRCSDGVSIHSWLLLHPHSREKKVPTLLFFHGNAGNIGLRLPNALQMFVSGATTICMLYIIYWIYLLLCSCLRIKLFLMFTLFTFLLPTAISRS